MPLWSSALLALLSLALLIIAVAAQAKSRRRRAREAYLRRLEDALADGTLSPEELAELEGLQLARDLSNAEVRMAALAIYRAAVRQVLADDRLDEQEDLALRSLQAQLGLSDEELAADHFRLGRLRLLAQVNAGTLPYVDAPVPLVPHERGHWVVQASFAERIGRGDVTDGLRGIRVPIPGEEPFNLDGARDALRPSEFVLPVDLGILVITTRRLIFQGAKRTVSIPHARMETIVLYEDGFLVLETGGVARGYLLVHDAELTTAVLRQAARRRRGESSAVRSNRTA